MSQRRRKHTQTAAQDKEINEPQALCMLFYPHNFNKQRTHRCAHSAASVQPAKDVFMKDATEIIGKHLCMNSTHTDMVFLPLSSPTSSCCLSSFIWVESWDRFSFLEASDRTVTVVSASWSHLRKDSSSLRDTWTPFSSPSSWMRRSLTLQTRACQTC